MGTVGVEVGGWKRKTHMLLYNMVSGTGSRKDSRGVQQRTGVASRTTGGGARGHNSGHMGTGAGQADGRDWASN